MPTDYINLNDRQRRILDRLDGIVDCACRPRKKWYHFFFAPKVLNYRINYYFHKPTGLLSRIEIILGADLKQKNNASSCSEQWSAKDTIEHDIWYDSGISMYDVTIILSPYRDANREINYVS